MLAVPILNAVRGSKLRFLPSPKLQPDSVRSLAAMLVDDEIEQGAASQGGETKGMS